MNYPVMNKIHGPDVSFYQDDKNTPKTIDFKRMRDVGKARYVINRYNNEHRRSNDGNRCYL